MWDVFSKVERTHFYKLSSYFDDNLEALPPPRETRDKTNYKPLVSKKNFSHLNEGGFLVGFELSPNYSTEQ